MLYAYAKALSQRERIDSLRSYPPIRVVVRVTPKKSRNKGVALSRIR
jgi:hypothetical protein